MPQRMRTDRVEQRVVVSCQVSDLEFAWSLAPHGDGTHITVDVLIPEREAARLPAQQDCIAQSLRRLAEVAARVGLTGRPDPGQTSNCAGSPAAP